MSENPEAPHTTLDKGQRIGVALLIGITVLLIILTFVQFNSSIRLSGKRASMDADAALDPEERAKKQTAALKKTDTDSDLLSDYDELSIYHTSPYIRDTDSDGTSDGEEVRRGTSPVCPEGADCSIDTVVAAENVRQQASSTPPAAAPQFQTSLDLPKAPPPSAAQSGQVSVAEIRTALIANGLPKEQIDALTDAELMQLVKEAQNEEASASASVTATTTTP